MVGAAPCPVVEEFSASDAAEDLRAALVLRQLIHMPPDQGALTCRVPRGDTELRVSVHRHDSGGTVVRVGDWHETRAGWCPVVDRWCLMKPWDVPDILDAIVAAQQWSGTMRHRRPAVFGASSPRPSGSRVELGLFMRPVDGDQPLFALREEGKPRPGRVLLNARELAEVSRGLVVASLVLSQRLPAELP